MLGGAVGLFLTDDHVALVGTTTSVGCLTSVAFTVYLFLRYSARYTARNATYHQSISLRLERRPVT